MKTKILKIVGIVVLTSLTLLWITPYLFKGKISSFVKDRFHKDLKAHADFSDVNISWFRHFPKISVGLNNLRIVGVGEFEGDTLISAKQLDIACNLGSFFPGDSIKISTLIFNEPRVRAIVHKDGHSNWDILKADSSPSNIASSEKTLKLEIKSYAIHNGYVYYEDGLKNIVSEIFNLEHEGKGNFGSDLFKLKTKTTADAINFNFGGTIPYRVSAKTKMNLTFEVENKAHKYSFNTDEIFLNDLKLHTDGFFQWINDSSYNMDIKFSAPSDKFKNILSMLPSVYQKDFASIKSNGLANFNGFVKGKYDEKHSPAYRVNLDIKNGSFQYPDLPMGMENIGLAVAVENPDGQPDHAAIEISRGHVEINDDKLDFHLSAKNPKSKPFIDFAFIGKLDLANISKIIKLEPGTKLTGVLDADITAKGVIPGMEKQKKDQFQSKGNFELKDFQFVSKLYPGGIGLNDLSLIFNSKNILIDHLEGEYLSSHINATGALNNLFAFALNIRPLNASIDLDADDVNLRDWLTAGRGPKTNGHENSNFIVPKNVDLLMHVKSDKLHYDDVDLQHLNGNLAISDGTVQLDHIKAESLEGTIEMNGTYSTWQSDEYPEIAFDYDVKGMDIQKTFFAFNTLQKLMPVGKYMSGKFNAQMSLNGRLGNDMAPELQSLHGEGNVSLLDASMKDFGPLDKLSESLDIATLQVLLLRDTRADFSYKNMKVTVAPFIAHGGDIDMEVAGTHGFDQTLSYNVSLKVPRDQLGKKGTVFVKNVVKEAAKKGIPVKLKDAVIMNVKMAGTINTPDVKTDMNSVVDNAELDLKRELNDFVNAKLDSAEQQLHQPPATKKQMAVQASYKTRNNSKTKSSSATTHKNTSHKATKKKQKNTRKYYSSNSKKDKTVASNRKK